MNRVTTAGPGVLYGRDTELSALIAALEQGSRGPGHLVIVTGAAGTGKSALVRAATTHARTDAMLYAEGTFDPRRGSFPYAVVMSCAATLAEQLLSLPATEVAQWRTRLLAELGPLAGVTADLAPEIAALLGPLPPRPDSPTSDEQLQAAIAALLRGLTSPEHPLVIFIDDLQWADNDTLDLLEVFTRHTTVDHAALIVAFRDDEISDDPAPVMHALERAPTQPGLTHLRLGPLAVADIADLIDDTWPGIVDLDQLAAIVARKTGGNPFYVQQMVAALADRQLVRVDSHSGHWLWNAPGTAALPVSDNVVGAITQRVADYPPHVREALQVAAALGDRFELGDLAAVLAVGTAYAYRQLVPALDDDVIRPSGDGERHFRFAHDRVRQAAYRNAAADQSAATLHVRIAEVLAARNPDGSAATAIADHFILGREAVTQPRQRIEVASLHLAAARASQRAIAPEAAARYFESGIALLPDDVWNVDYRLAFELYRGAAEVEAGLRRTEVVGRHLDVLRTHARSDVDQLRLQALETTHLLRTSDVPGALTTAFAAIETAGVLPGPWPMAGDRERLDRALDEIARRLAGHRPGDLLASLPAATAPHVIATFEVVASMADAISIRDSALLHLLAAEVSLLVLDHGQHPAGGTLVVCLTDALLNTDTRGIDVADLGAAGLAMATPHDYTRLRSDVSYLRFIDSWMAPAADFPDLAQACAARCEAAHDSYIGGFARNLGILGKFCLGRSMSDVWDGWDQLARHSPAFAPGPVDLITLPLAEAAKAIAGLTPALTTFDPAFDTAAYVEYAAAVPLLQTPLRSARATLYALAGRHADVLDQLDHPCFTEAPVLQTVLPNLFWKGLAHAELATDSPATNTGPGSTRRSPNCATGANGSDRSTSSTGSCSWRASANGWPGATPSRGTAERSAARCTASSSSNTGPSSNATAVGWMRRVPPSRATGWCGSWRSGPTARAKPTPWRRAWNAPWPPGRAAPTCRSPGASRASTRSTRKRSSQPYRRSPASATSMPCWSGCWPWRSHRPAPTGGRSCGGSTTRS